MRRVVLAKRGGHYDGKEHDWCKLECRHIVTPENNGLTFRVNGKTKARCYACAGATEQRRKVSAPKQQISSIKSTKLVALPY
jgi:hypothetical protein